NGLVGHPQFMQYTVLPRLNRRADHLNQLLPHFGFRPGEAWFAYDNPVPEDRAYTASRNTAYVAGGIMTPNEARISEGLDPIEDESADRLLVNGVPLGQTIGFGLPSAGSVADAPEPEQQPQAGAGATAGAAEAAAQGTAAVQDTALNGAQVEALINLASLVAQGQLPKDAARQIALAAFPGIDPAKVEAIFASIDEGAAEPEPEPEPPAAQEGADDEQAADAGEDQGEGEKGQSHADLWAKWRDPCECAQGIDHKAADPRFDRKPVRGFVRSLRGYYAAKAEAVASMIEAAEPFVKAGPSDFLERLGIGARDFDDLLKAASSSYIQRGVESGAKEGLDTLRDLLGEAMPA